MKRGTAHFTMTSFHHCNLFASPSSALSSSHAIRFSNISSTRVVGGSPFKRIKVEFFEDLSPFKGLEIYETTLRKLERDPRSKLHPYIPLDPHPPQIEVVYFNAATREALFDWVSGVHRKMKLQASVLHRAINYADTFLIKRGAEAFFQDSGHSTNVAPARQCFEGAALYLSSGSEVQLSNKMKRLMVTCLFVAAKIEGTCPEITHSSDGVPKIEEFVTMCEVPSFRFQYLIIAERALVQTLDHRLHYPTALCFASIYINGLFLENISRRKDYEILTSVSLEAAMLSHESLSYMPSLLGASAVAYIANRVFLIPIEKLITKFESAGHAKAALLAGIGFHEKVLADLREQKAENLSVNRKYKGWSAMFCN
jgi:hypothetical protein